MQWYCTQPAPFHVRPPLYIKLHTRIQQFHRTLLARVAFDDIVEFACVLLYGKTIVRARMRLAYIHITIHTATGAAGIPAAYQPDDAAGDAAVAIHGNSLRTHDDGERKRLLLRHDYCCDTTTGATRDYCDSTSLLLL